MNGWVAFLVFWSPLIAAWVIKEAIEKAAVRASVDTDRLMQAFDRLSADIGSLESRLDQLIGHVREVAQNTEPPRVSSDHFDI